MSSANFQPPRVVPYYGDPNGNMSGHAEGFYGQGTPPDLVWDTQSRLVWACTTTGNTLAAVWTPMSVTNIRTPVMDLATVSSGTITLDRSQAVVFEMIVGGNITLDITNWIPDGYTDVLVSMINGGSATVTFPSGILWVKSDGTTTTNFSSYGTSLQSSGTDWILFWTLDAGDTVYAKLIR